MPGRKIEDEGEVIRWFDEGRTYDWMVQQYRHKYAKGVQPSMFGNFRRRRGLARRIVRNDDLVPWHVREEHRWAYSVAMLRAEARRRAGKEVPHADLERLESFKKSLEEQSCVIHYDPSSKEGFIRVPRRPGIDNDLIREPRRKTTLRPPADQYEPPG